MITVVLILTGYSLIAGVVLYLLYKELKAEEKRRYEELEGYKRDLWFIRIRIRTR